MMKTKKNKKKLVLNKISIAQLDTDKIQEIKGGRVTSSCTTKEGPSCPHTPLPNT